MQTPNFGGNETDMGVYKFSYKSQSQMPLRCEQTKKIKRQKQKSSPE